MIAVHTQVCRLFCVVYIPLFSLAQLGYPAITNIFVIDQIIRYNRVLAIMIFFFQYLDTSLQWVTTVFNFLISPVSPNVQPVNTDRFWVLVSYCLKTKAGNLSVYCDSLEMFCSRKYPLPQVDTKHGPLNLDFLLDPLFSLQKIWALDLNSYR